jgi:hypothetical protein
MVEQQVRLMSHDVLSRIRELLRSQGIAFRETEHAAAHTSAQSAAARNQDFSNRREQPCATARREQCYLPGIVGSSYYHRVQTRSLELDRNQDSGRRASIWSRSA